MVMDGTFRRRVAASDNVAATTEEDAHLAFAPLAAVC
jgi:hypothetical protein